MLSKAEAAKVNINGRVLILVLMEYALEVIFIIHQLYDVKYCLNPCSNGICSRSESNDKQSGTSAKLS